MNADKKDIADVPQHLCFLSWS